MTREDANKLHAEIRVVLFLVIGLLLGGTIMGTITSNATIYQQTLAWCERIAKSSAPYTFAECLQSTAEVSKP
jgi:hypothetical protein